MGEAAPITKPIGERYRSAGRRHIAEARAALNRGRPRPDLRLVTDDDELPYRRDIDG